MTKFFVVREDELQLLRETAYEAGLDAEDGSEKGGLVEAEAACRSRPVMRQAKLDASLRWEHVWVEGVEPQRPPLGRREIEK